MYDEQHDFLPLRPGGSSVLVVGGLDKSLTERITAQFERVVIADWDAERLDWVRSTVASKTVETQVIASGKPLFPADKFDLILVFWALSYLGDPGRWIAELNERLNPKGRLAVIDRIDRSSAPEQEITGALMELRLESDAVAGVDLHPGCSAERFDELVRSGFFSHVRRRIFTDQDLLTGKEYWREETTRILSNLNRLPSSPEDKLIAGLHYRAAKLRDQLGRMEPCTPPFFMTTAIKRSTSWVPVVEPYFEPSFAETGETATTLYLSKLSDDDVNPYNRILLYGPGSLKSAELMALILSGLPEDTRKGFDAHQLAQRLIHEYGDKAISKERNPVRLSETMGISLAVACNIVSVFELGRRHFIEPYSSETIIRGPEDCYSYLREMSTLKKEHLRGLYLNVQSRLIYDEVISIGTLSRSVVHPREVFAPALEHAANSVILAHNHPSGDLTPSEADVAVTKQLAQAGRIMGIELLDHLIIGSGGFVSLKKRRII